MLRIRSKIDGFRRCGVPHSSEWKEYPDGTFTPQQVETLKAEPMLQVEEVASKKQAVAPAPGKMDTAGADQGADDASGEDMTKAQIIARLTELGVEVPRAANKPELQALLDEALVEAAKSDQAKGNEG